MPSVESGLIGVLAFAVVGLLIAFFLKFRRDERRIADMQGVLVELSRLVVRSQGTNSSILRSMMALEEKAGVQWALFDEVLLPGNEKLERASDLLYAHRKSDMKAIHHAGLRNPDDQQALRSSFALATEFGDEGSLDLMASLEGIRAPENVSAFQEHQRALARRLEAAARQRLL